VEVAVVEVPLVIAEEEVMTPVEEDLDTDVDPAVTVT
jgi:hypothetical protein